MEFAQTVPRTNAGRSKELQSNAVFGYKQNVSLKERLFAMWFRQLVYTQIWEDPVMDMKALNLASDDHVVTIASGGCNALSTQVKANLHKLSFEQRNIQDAIARMDMLSVDALVLLDAQDWMSDEEITASWREITRTAKPGARLIFRTGGVTRPVDLCLTGDLQGKWVRDHATSDALSPTDRSGIYGAFHSYPLQA
jgi:hypothetical protein